MEKEVNYEEVLNPQKDNPVSKKKQVTQHKAKTIIRERNICLINQSNRLVSEYNLNHYKKSQEKIELNLNLGTADSSESLSNNTKNNINECILGNSNSSSYSHINEIIKYNHIANYSSNIIKLEDYNNKEKNNSKNKYHVETEARKALGSNKKISSECNIFNNKEIDNLDDNNNYDVYLNRKNLEKSGNPYFMKKLTLQRERITNINYLVIMLVALSQGIQAISELAIIYLYKDDFKLQPFQVSQIAGIMTIPWIIKPLYGFISDSFPIFDYRRKPYLFIAGMIVTMNWILMCFWVNTVLKAIIVLFITSMCTAFYNVIGEALVIELSQFQKDTDPESGAKNVSLYFMVKSSGHLCAALLSGYLIEIMDKRYSKFILIIIYHLNEINKYTL